MALEVPRLKVFISWAGSHAEKLGLAFHTYLPDAVNTILPFMSGVTIDKGTRWSGALSGSLQESPCAIVCLTPESIESPWVAFETGAVSKAAGGPDGARVRIWTYLFGLEKQNLQLTPFAEYQATSATKEETFSLIKSINNLSPDPVSPETLERRYESSFWPNFSKALAEVPNAASAADRSKLSPAPPDLLEEILRTVRAVQRDIYRGAVSRGRLSFEGQVVREFDRRGLGESCQFERDRHKAVTVERAGSRYTFAPQTVSGVESGALEVSEIVDFILTRSGQSSEAETSGS